MSVLRENQLEACEKDLAGLPSRCLFDSACTDADAEALYSFSWYAEEDRRAVAAGRVQPSLHTAEELRVRVLSSFAPELALLSVEEHDLLVRLILLGGHTSLPDWDELLPARSLVRRLWCGIQGSGEQLTLTMPHQLCASALLLLAGDSHKEIRSQIENVHESIDNTLYLMGMMQASAPFRHLEELLKGTPAEGRADLIGRFLRSGYDYVFDPEGHMMLIHPGLAEPGLMLSAMSRAFRTDAFAEISADSLNKTSDSINELESPLYERMLFLVTDVVRPEITAEDAVEDLIILAKQEAPYEDMLEVLSSQLICQPTPEMLKALRDIRERVPRWLYLSASSVQ